MAFAAKYPGHCTVCGQPFDAGDLIVSSFGKGYAHDDHDRTSMAASVTQRRSKPAPKKPGQKVADGTVGHCEKCGATAVVNSVRITGRRGSVQVCSKCHTSLVVPLRSRTG